MHDYIAIHLVHLQASHVIARGWNFKKISLTHQSCWKLRMCSFQTKIYPFLFDLWDQSYSRYNFIRFS